MVEDLTQARPRSTSGRLLPKGRKKVKLYHASTIRVEHPDVQHSRPNLDFEGQACRGQYELDDAISDFTVKRFEAYDSDTYGEKV